MAMRIVWGLHDSEAGGLNPTVLFEDEFLLDQYRELTLKQIYLDMTKATPERDYLPGEESLKESEDILREAQAVLLALGRDRWVTDQMNGEGIVRFTKQKYELWNSVPPNMERLIVHFDT